MLIAAYNHQSYMSGIGLLLLVVFLWTASNFVTQDLYNDGYAKPFLVTYLNTASFALYLLPFFVFKRRAPSNDIQSGLHGEGYAYQSLAESPRPEAVPPASRGSIPPLTTNETANLALIFCLLWFIANWTVNASLEYTSVASSMILSGTSGFFTLGVSYVFRVETLNLAKIAAVITSFCGVVLVSLSDSYQESPAPDILTSERHQPILGDFLALISAVFYALYVIFLKVRVGSESRINMQLFFGFVGLFNVLLCWPVGLVLHRTGIEPFEWPTSGRVIRAIMVITLTSDYMYVIAMLKTTPVVVTVGLSLTIPFAVIGDTILGHPVQVQVLIGAILVMISFVTIGLESREAI
ncbi:hypothetical protein AMATHDRAFT_134985 [Amanita thiersii Skay4041]|uniref:Uncharacterized protein n=1 Tax=Amanita thiersii Skay4041 TaxID=703135 RepID=A0A2A9P1G3_9AGAR|nr:hypothetical protein AMATHDRAFT_134985 [Amanita thiersii Skay4041]